MIKYHFHQLPNLRKPGITVLIERFIIINHENKIQFDIVYTESSCLVCALRLVQFTLG